MPLPPPASYLQEDEVPVFQGRRDPRSVAGPLLAILAAGAVAVTASVILGRVVGGRAGDGLAWSLGALAVVVAVSSCVAVVLRMRTSRYLVTAQRLYKSYGRLRFNLLQTTYDKVTDMHVHQGMLGRAFGYGTVRAFTAGASLSFDGVQDPFGVKRRMEEARTAFLEELVRTHRRAPKAAVGTKPGASHAAAAKPTSTVWEGRPALQSFVGRLIGTAFFLVPALALILMGLFVEARLLWMGLLVLAFAAMSGVATYVQYRYSRYEVTSRGVVVTTGWLARRRVETTFEKVTDVTTTQTVLGRILGYGDIKVNTAGSNQAPVGFTGIAEPEAVKRIIDGARGA